MPDTHERYDRQRYLDRCFEFLKHVTTLGTAAALLTLAIYGETLFRARLLEVTLILIGLCVVISLFGMQVITISHRKPPPDQTVWSEGAEDRLIGGITNTAGAMFAGSILAFTFTILETPFWPGIGAIAALVVFLLGLGLFVSRRHRRRSSTDKSPEPETDVETRPWWRRIFGG